MVIVIENCAERKLIIVALLIVISLSENNKLLTDTDECS
jgi:hypothetical protein